MSNFINVTLYRSPNDRRPVEDIAVNVNMIQVIERHGTGSRIQFNLNEPALICNETKEAILSLITETTTLLKRVK